MPKGRHGRSSIDVTLAEFVSRLDRDGNDNQRNEHLWGRHFRAKLREEEKLVKKVVHCIGDERSCTIRDSEVV